MNGFKHIVQVHPVELGEPNLHKVEDESEFDSKEEAEDYIAEFNKQPRTWLKNGAQRRVTAVYAGRVNIETGELE